MTKKVLIIALAKDWTGISRLPSGLDRAGFETVALCPSGSYLSKTKHLAKAMTYPTFTFTRSKLVYLWMLAAMVRFKADIILPGDEDALLAMQNLANTLSKIPGLSFLSKELRKFTAPEKFDSVVLNKSRFVENCREWGVRVPKNTRVENLDMALHEVPSFGYPVVLKFDFGYGASGVTVCQNETDLRKAFSKHSTVGIAKKIKELIKNLLFVVQESAEAGISLQQYISGPVGLVPFVASNGQIFAINPMLKHKTYPGATGPSSVVKGIDNQEIRNAVKIAAEKLSYSGFGSLDFIIDEITNEAYIIELNPRPVPTSHFSSDLCAEDLCVALHDGLTKEQDTKAPAFKPYTIALFPNEKRRDPNSKYLTEAHHDIPKNDPALLKALESK
ncbi:ATP-grasp domain-containing protein [Bdellovibrio sp. HCB274]|uniref:ATP-binding protein n=1 Tax=Bdellovibrio sp. HCB274 TaxID=3394361 RepID=UPI0039B635C2